MKGGVFRLLHAIGAVKVSPKTEEIWGFPPRGVVWLARDFDHPAFADLMGAVKPSSSSTAGKSSHDDSSSSYESDNNDDEDGNYEHKKKKKDSIVRVAMSRRRKINSDAEFYPHS